MAPPRLRRVVQAVHGARLVRAHRRALRRPAPPRRRGARRRARGRAEFRGRGRRRALRALALVARAPGCRDPRRVHDRGVPQGVRPGLRLRPARLPPRQLQPPGLRGRARELDGGDRPRPELGAVAARVRPRAVPPLQGVSGAARVPRLRRPRRDRRGTQPQRGRPHRPERRHRALCRFLRPHGRRPVRGEPPKAMRVDRLRGDGGVVFLRPRRAPGPRVRRRRERPKRTRIRVPRSSFRARRRRRRLRSDRRSNRGGGDAAVRVRGRRARRVRRRRARRVAPRERRGLQRLRPQPLRARPTRGGPILLRARREP